MSVLVDTTVWSIALRRPTRRLSAEQRAVVDEWRHLVEDGEAVIIGPIRQEILSGVRDESNFVKLREHLSGIACVDIRIDDYDEAATFFNRLRAKGIVGSTVDLIICAVSYRCHLSIFTTDGDFARYARHLPIRLHG